MNIPAINNLNLSSVFKVKQNNPNSNYSLRFGLKMAQPLSKDSISFRGTPKQRVLKKAGATMADFWGQNIEKTNPNLKPVAYRFLDTIEAVVSTMQQNGHNIVAMPRTIAEQHVLKSGNSARSKALRSRTLDLTDRIRTTVYVQDLYDLSTLYNFVDKMALRGYKIAKTEEPVNKMLAKGCKLTESEIKKGTVKVDDISIRLCNEEDTTLRNVCPEISFALDGMQKSGYEDIQLRFLNGKDKFETILLFGPKYAEAKHMESEMIRKYTREFETLTIINDYQNNPLIQSGLERVKQYKDSILGLFYDGITKPLYHHARGIDYRNIEELKTQSPQFMRIDYKIFDENFKSLKSSIGNCYNSLSKRDAQKAKQFEEKMYADLHTVNQIRKGLEQSGEKFGVLEIPPEVKKRENI